MRSAIILFSTVGLLGSGCAVDLDPQDDPGDDVELVDRLDEIDLGTAVGDEIAPVTTITQGPDWSHLDPAARFEFSADEPADFECSLDGGRFVACSSPAEYADLDLGGHQFRVRATDLYGNPELTPVAWSWRGCSEMSTEITAAAAVTMCNVTGNKGPLNRLAAYVNPDNNTFQDTTGWTGYDLSSLPEEFSITEMTVHYFHESGFSNPFAAPLTMFHYSTASHWSRDSVTLGDLQRRTATSGRTNQYAISAWNAFPIDLAGFDLGKNVDDGWITLGITNTNPEYSHVLFFGIEDPAFAPYLEVVGYSCQAPNR